MGHGWGIPPGRFKKGILAGAEEGREEDMVGRTKTKSRTLTIESVPNNADVITPLVAVISSAVSFQERYGMRYYYDRTCCSYCGCHGYTLSSRKPGEREIPEMERFHRQINGSSCRPSPVMSAKIDVEHNPMERSLVPTGEGSSEEMK
ncbi:hypothetical protein INR49_023539, partial [Caranx melampygus]